MDENNLLAYSQNILDEHEKMIEEDDDDDLLTSEELFRRLQQAWLNEKYSPVLLKHESLLVHATFELLDDIDKRLKASENKTTSFRWLMHRTEYNRLYFILCSYVRTRCFKIEEYPSTALTTEELLSPEECVYAQTYLNNMKEHLKKSVLIDLKSEQQQQDCDDKTLIQLLPKPNRNDFVFFHVDQSVQGLVLSHDQANHASSDDVIDLKTNDQLIMQFRHIHQLLNDKHVHLV
jgi:GINS complex subunit 4